MKHELSILIPVYNYSCIDLIHNLCRQAQQLSTQGLVFEVIVAEDGSTNEESLAANAVIASLPHCRYLPFKQNVGRAAIRNLLAQESRYEWLLFLDCDMQLPGDNFLLTYIQHEGADVIDGGFGVTEQPQLLNRNLRYSYEWTEQANHSASQRRQHPYRSFRTTNFMISRNVMMANPFDERFRHYGYEDVMFGKKLRQQGITIAHIDNPMMLSDNETNLEFVEKTEEAIRTLHQFRDDLRGYSRLLTLVDGIHVGLVRSAIRLGHRLAGPLERRNLCGNHPRLMVFKLYKLGYYLTLTDNDHKQLNK